MKERFSFVVTAVLIFLLVPVIITLLLSGRQSITIEKAPDAENYLAGIVYRQVSADYPLEAVKAQVVLARSTFVRQVKEGSMTKKQLEQIAQNLKTDMENRNFDKQYERIQRAVINTRGEVLAHDGEVCFGVFHRLSTGRTRNAKGVLQDDSYQYLTGVESVKDQEADDYLTGHYFTPAFLEKEFRDFGITYSASSGDVIEVTERDEADYVISVTIGSQTCTGEELRQILRLPSASFVVEQMDGKVRFLCRGAGHGLGMSQYGAGCMAREGSTYREILEHYFPQTEILVTKK
ncbi:SpoIID/LytB domain-containing protein [Ruminococcus gauvreauii]|uniref:SpoIID/LytB domain-containing protein n=1 Tax=Ruminococcus gauvreauii TaxID=438033 RepID=A0ABY5VLN4_9FIRM|nr:SpoIID/LytB domain-containing protein [Ruminococcus gauvreauii]UWP61212.1 SpoIID/LytB domain-containing protein [Ruminococcus gauvreauii]